MGEIVVDAVLHHGEVVRFGHGFDVEEFADGLEVGESGAQGLRADRVESSAEAVVDIMSMRGLRDKWHDGWRCWTHFRRLVSASMGMLMRAMMGGGWRRIRGRIP